MYKRRMKDGFNADNRLVAVMKRKESTNRR